MKQWETKAHMKIFIRVRKQNIAKLPLVLRFTHVMPVTPLQEEQKENH